MNLKKALLFLIIDALLTVSCTRRTQAEIDYSGEAADFYIANEIYPWLYSIDDVDNGVFCYLLIGEESALLYDTTYGYGSLHRVIRQITELPVTVVLGHGHFDHTGGAPQLFAYLHSDVWLHEADFNLYRTGDQEMRFIKKLNIGQVFDLGGLNVEVIGMEGHTAGSIGILVREHRVLLVSDSANPSTWLFLLESLPMDQYIKMLERTILLDFDTFFVGHNDEPMPKSDFQIYMNAARNATVEKSEPYDNIYFDNVYIYEENGASVLFRDDSGEGIQVLAQKDLPPGNLGAFELTLKDNFLYGNGYQGLIRDRYLLNGHRLRKGEVYTLKVTYTATRDLENDLLVGFVDMAGGRWKTLSYTQKAIEPPNVILGHASKAGEEVSSEVTISIETNASISTPAANTLVLETIGQGRHRSSNSGVQGPETIFFSEFVLSKKL
jgi:glyoxylase-like metal-dependent hydrolase (beta-lactamase superfamily II)